MVAGLFTTSLLSLILPVLVLAGPHSSGPLIGRHHELARRAESNVQLFQRDPGSRWTFYNAETGSAGSCGDFLSNSGFTVAMNADQMNSGWCNKPITMTFGGKTTTAIIKDTCPGCPWNGLDLTEGLFNFFAASSAGVITGDWEFGDSAPPPPPPTTTWLPIPSLPPIWSPPPSPSFTNKPTSTKWSDISSSTPHSSAPTSSSTTATVSSIDFSTGPASGLAEPTGVVSAPPGAPNNVDIMNQAYIAIGALMIVAHDG